MNKLDLNSVEWISAGGKARGSRDVGAAFWVSFANSKGSPYSVSITVYANEMKRLRWLCGDRVEVGITDTHIILKRTSDGRGRALVAASTSSNKASQKGSAVTCNLQLVHELSRSIEKYAVLSADVITQGDVVAIPLNVKRG